MEQEKILEIAVQAGSILLRFGAETYRVEETIKTICNSYDLECEPFALTTGVFVSVEGEKGVSTIFKRISSRTVDLTKIARLNALSRRIQREKPGYNEIKQEINDILKGKSYSNIIIALSYAFTALIYAYLFGGSYNDALSALVVGLLLGLSRPVFSRDNSRFPFIEYFADGFAAGILSSVASIFIPDTNVYIVIIGAVTNLLPGVALTNGVRDLLHGDNISGLTRLGEAFIVVAVLAFGTGMGLALWTFGGF